MAGKVDGRGVSVRRDFPEIERGCRRIQGSMGMSYELADAHVADMRAQVWTLTRATFTGAAILLREKAAYRRRAFRLTGLPVRARRVSVCRGRLGQ
jgi:hypothetical protein